MKTIIFPTNSFLSSCIILILILILILLSSLTNIVNGQPLVPALFLFGDSTSDAGNNNNLDTLIKADFPPYGRDFITPYPSGRFCNGKLATDFTAENLGFPTYPPAYLSNKAKGKNLLIGANFASAASGYYEGTARIYNTIPLSKQLQLYKEYQNKLVVLIGKLNATNTINGSIHIVNAGSSDFVQNYYINPLLYKVYTPDQFSDILIDAYVNFIQGLYKLGARKIGVTTLAPLGCLPAVITLFSEDTNKCVEKINEAALSFNNKINATSESLLQKYSGLNLVVLDIYQPLLNIVNNSTDNGFVEARKACCGSGLIETSFLCNAKSPGTCSNASEYVFWDGFHPTEATNLVLSNDLLVSGLSLI